jgi:hypothetical protein
MNLSNFTIDFVRKNFSDRQRKVIRDLVELRFFAPLLSKRTVLILGCQRSGTTLTFLLLNSHPQITIFDETESRFDYPLSATIYRNWIDGYYTGCKLPTKVTDIEYIAKYFPHARIIFPIRNPYSVISSMRSLSNSQGSWIDRCAKNELINLISLYPEVAELNLDELDEVSLGAYIWKYKNLAVEKYRAKGLNIFPFKYEDLLENPQKVGTEILNFIGVDWNDNLLEHEKFYQANKAYAGKTRGDVPLNTSRKDPKLKLSESEINTIASICQEPMNIYHY